MKKDRQLVILLAALLVLIFLSSCAAGKNTSMTPAATDFAYAEDDSYTRDAPAEEPQAEAPMANEYKAEIGGAMGEMSFDDTAEAEEAPTGSPESAGEWLRTSRKKSSTPRTFPSRRPTLMHLFPD